MGPGVHQHLVRGRVPPGHRHHSPQDLHDKVVVTVRTGERGQRGAQSLWGPSSAGEREQQSPRGPCLQQGRGEGTEGFLSPTRAGGEAEGSQDPHHWQGRGERTGDGDRWVLGISKIDRARVRGQRSPQGPHHQQRGREGGTEGSPGTLSPAGQGRGDRGILGVPVTGRVVGRLFRRVSSRSCSWAGHLRISMAL